MAKIHSAVPDLFEIMNEQHKRFYLGDGEFMDEGYFIDELIDEDEEAAWLIKARAARALGYERHIIAA